MKINRLFLFGLMLAGMFVYISCRKIDRQEDVPGQSSAESKFFSGHASTNPLVQALTQFVKRENGKYNFTDKIVKQIGYPHWDKAIVTSGKRKIGSRVESDSTNTTFIPFALDSQNVVNASLVITTTPLDTTFQFLRDWQYKSRINGSPTTDTTAENMAALFMLLDNAVFGHTRFNLTDSTLFAAMPTVPGETGRDIVINNPPIGGKSNLTQLQTIMVCFYGYVCNTPTYCANLGGCDYTCPSGLCYATSTCFDFEVESGTGGGGGSGGGTGGGTGGGSGSGSGGGSSGGGWTPPQCPTASRNSLFEECISGWEPYPGNGGVPPKDPCDKVAPLKTDTAYINKSMELKNSTNLNYEKAYVQRNDGVFIYKEGPPNEGKVDLIIRDTVLNINHSHYDGKMFSIDDLWTAWSFQIADHLVDSAFTLGVTTNAGTSYVFTIDDPALFIAFGSNYFGTEGNYKDLEDKYRKGYKVGIADSASLNETRFLEFMRDEKIGISLLKANDTFTSYTRLILNRNGILTPVPCN